MRRRRFPVCCQASVSFVGFRFPPEVIDVLVSSRRDTRAARRLFTAVIGAHGVPGVVTTDRSPFLARAIVGVVPDVAHDTIRYANNRVEADNARLKVRLGVDACPKLTIAAAFDELLSAV